MYLFFILFLLFYFMNILQLAYMSHGYADVGAAKKWKNSVHWEEPIHWGSNTVGRAIF